MPSMYTSIPKKGPRDLMADISDLGDRLAGEIGK